MVNVSPKVLSAIDRSNFTIQISNSGILHSLTMARYPQAIQRQEIHLKLIGNLPNPLEPQAFLPIFLPRRPLYLVIILPASAPFLLQEKSPGGQCTRDQSLSATTTMSLWIIIITTNLHCRWSFGVGLQTCVHHPCKPVAITLPLLRHRKCRHLHYLRLQLQASRCIIMGFLQRGVQWWAIH